MVRAWGAAIAAAWTFGMFGCGPDLTAKPPPKDPIGTSRAALTGVTGFGSNPGNLSLYEFDPPTPAASAGLVVALHGCLGSAAIFEQTGWDSVASAAGFYVLYGETTENNGCFDWFDPTQAHRGNGQALSLQQGIQWMQAHHAIDASKIFIAGFSGGAAMTAEQLAAYPDVYAGGAVYSGVPDDCATDANSSPFCLLGVDKTEQQWGDLARAGDPGYAGTYPRVVIFQGTADTTVAPINAVELARQWVNVHGIADTASSMETVGAGVHSTFTDSAGNSQVETWLFNGMGHAVPIAPGINCGTAGLYTVDEGVCAAQVSAAFFGLVAGGSGTGGGSGSGGGSGGGGSPAAGCAAFDPSTLGLVVLLGAGLRRRRH